MTQPAPPLAQIEAALLAGEIPRAVGLARQALDHGARAPLLFVLRARWLEANGHADQAAADLEQALSANPSDANLLAAQSRCLAAAGRFVRAAAAARAALAVDPALAEAQYNLGFALEQLGELDQARAAYEAAIARDPTLADACARLAGLAARRGDWTEARRLADRAPDHAAARFARIMADLAERRFAQAESEARRIADAANIAPAVRTSARSLLADALDGQDRTDEAFAAYNEARTIQKNLSQPQFERPGIETGRQMAGRLAIEFEATAPRSAAEASPARSPIFVLGFPRSGTTLLAEILAGHPGAVILDEKPTLRDAILEFTGQPGGLARLAAANEAEIARWRARYWQRAEEYGGAGDVIVDKVPVNTLHLPVIARLFPGARIVFALRDPRDVVFGCFRRQFAINPFTYEFLSLDGAAWFYDSTMRLAERYRAHLPLDLLTVRNEDLIAHPDTEVGRLCAFLGIPPSPAMTDFSRRAERRAIASPDAARLGGGIEPARTAPWRRYADQMAPVLPLLAPWVQRFGYGD